MASIVSFNVSNLPSKLKKYPKTFSQKSLKAIFIFSKVRPSSCLTLSIKSKNALTPPFK